MALEELERELYKRGRKTREAAKPAQEAGKKEAPSSEWEEEPPQPEKMRAHFHLFGRKLKPFFSMLFGFALVGILALAGWVAYLMYVTGAQADMKLVGPIEVRAGAPTQYEVVLENQSRSVMTELSLTFRADGGIEFAEAVDRRVLQRTLGYDLPPGTIRKEVVTVASWGKEGDVRTLEATLRYRQGAGASRFEKDHSLKIKIVQSAVSLEASLPKKVISNEDFSFSLGFQNEMDDALLQPRAELFLPAEFAFLSAAPPPEATATPVVWEFPKLERDSSARVSVSGRIAGDEGDVRAFHLALGIRVRGVFIPLAESDFGVAVSANPLALAIVANGAKDYQAALGEDIFYTVSFKNNFDITLNDVVITAVFHGELYNPVSVVTGGAYLSGERKITWHGGNTPQLLALKPQESGFVHAKISLSGSFPQNMKNPTVKVGANISTVTKPKFVGAEKPLSQDAELETKVKGFLEIEPKIYRKDPLALFSNKGAWPMKVNQPAEFAVYITAKAFANDFSDIYINTVLPNNVSFAGNIKGDLADTEFVANPRTSEIVWKIPKLEAWTSKRIMFKVSAIPSVIHANSALQLFSSVAMVGIDMFTGNEYLTRSENRDSTMLDDPGFRPNDGMVQP